MSAGPSDTSLVRYTLADGSAKTVAAPIDPEAVNRGTLTGAGAIHGELILTANGASTRLFRAGIGDAAATPVGPALAVRSRAASLLGIGARAAVVADCRGVWILPLPGARRWVRRGEGCWAALAPEGGAIVYSPDGHHVVQRSMSGGAAEPLFDVRALLRSFATSAAPMLVGVPAWGAAGLAFMARAGDQFAVFVRNGNGTITEVLQETYANVFRVPRIAWEPGRNLLAIADDVSPSGAVLRVYDPATETLRALMLSPVGFAGIAWAPEGGAIATLSGTGQLVVVDLDGRWLVRRDSNWKRLIGWSGAG